MKILVTGGRGQLGRSVLRRGGAAGHTVAALDVDELDITDVDQLDARLAEVQPTLVINAAAFTGVDHAEAQRDRAYAINARGAGNVAEVCERLGVPMLHVSTDYVFNGAATEPYDEDQAIAPLGVYGASKAEGELRVLDAGGTVVRTSWLFAARGPSFVQTMVRLATDRPVLRVVADQRGCPTWAEDLAEGLLAIAALPERESIYHYCNAEPTTWHGFAEAIIAEARTLRPLACERVEPITTAEYPTPARRPAYSVLDTSRIRAAGIAPPSWRPGLARVVLEDFGGA